MVRRTHLGLLCACYGETDRTFLESWGVPRTGGAHPEAGVLKSIVKHQRQLTFCSQSEPGSEPLGIGEATHVRPGLCSPLMDSKYYEMECFSRHCLYNMQQLTLIGQGVGGGGEAGSREDNVSFLR